MVMVAAGSAKERSTSSNKYEEMGVDMGVYIIAVGGQLFRGGDVDVEHSKGLVLRCPTS